MDNAVPPPPPPSAATGMRRVLANLGVLIGGKSVSGLLGLAYLALAVRTLGMESFGFLVVIHTVVEIAQNLSKFQSWQPILHYGTAALQSGRLDDLHRLVVFTARLDMGSALIGAAGAAAALWFFGSTLGLPAEILPSATLYAGSLLFMMTSTPTGLLRLFDRFNLAVLEDAVEALIRLLGAVALYVIGGELDAFLMLSGVSAVAGALTSIGFAWHEARRHGLQWRAPENRRLTDGFEGIWRFVLSTNANSSLALLSNQLATLTVGVLIGPPQAALFRLARQVAEAMAKPVKLMTTAIYPEFARFAAQDRLEAMREFLGRALRLSAVGAGICAPVLYLAGPWILTLIGGSQVVAAFPTMLLLGAAALIGVGTFALEPALISIGRATLALRIRLASAVLYLTALVILVARSGIEGAGIAAVGAAASMALMQFQSVLTCFRARRGGSTTGRGSGSSA